MDLKTNTLIKKANNIFLQNFPAETCFERAVFFSWYCKIRDCKYCYMSTQPDIKLAKKPAVRSKESLLAEVLLSKKLGWQFGFFSGGIDAFTQADFFKLLKLVYAVNKRKIWLNIGPLPEKQLKKYKPYTKGVVGSIETINPRVHKKVCPSKPIEPYEEMFESALKLKMKTAMTIILGLGETKKDFLNLADFIKKYKISKIHFYGLNPQKGTPFEKSKPPSMEYQAWWIAKTRIEFPKLDIQAGIWQDRIDYVSLLLKAGANSISKFPALKCFNRDAAKELEIQVVLAQRIFKGSLTTMPNLDWEQEIEALKLSKELKKKVLQKLLLYLKKMV